MYSKFRADLKLSTVNSRSFTVAKIALNYIIYKKNVNTIHPLHKEKTYRAPSST